MLRQLSVLSALLAQLAGVWAQNDTQLPAVLDATIIESLGNNSLFTRWRPHYHFIAPAGWMNDPCAMMYDPTRDIYHLMYQWHPNHINWGNISWGHATSQDLITWEDVGGWENNDAEAIAPGPVGSYNGLGIFSGTAQPYNLQGEQDGTLIAFYTSVSALPTNWRIPYIPGTEKQSFAISKDGGETWSQYEGNPVITGPPEGWNITGFRDPFMEPWPEMDALLGNEEPHFYTVFGSGIKGVGPRIPFYSAPANNLTDWTFLGALWEPAQNTSLGDPLETGSYGFNFEVSNFFSLADEDGDLHYYVMMGAEGGNTTLHDRQSWGLWNEGVVTRRENGSAQFTPISGGAIDYGLLYAVTSFWDAKNERRVQWGWASEDMGDFALTQQGFQGAFAVPRVLYVKKTTGLLNVDGGLTKMGHNRVVEQSDGTFTAYTLGGKPAEDVVLGLRNGSTQSNYDTADISGDSILGSGSSRIEIMATLSDFDGPAGLTVAASPGSEEYTHIWFDPSNYTVVVERSHSSSISDFVNTTVYGYFYPYTHAETSTALGSNSTNSTAKGVTEDLEFHIFLDGSLLEVIINDRFWLTTRIYPSREDSTGFGVFIPDGSSVSVGSFAVWDNLYNVFPGRPLNSSSPLVWDSAEQTNNYTWWTGN